MRLDDLRGRRVALLGMGIDVAAALPAIVASEPHDLVVVDDRLTVDRTDGLAVVPLASAARDAEIFVRSPGFPRSGNPLQHAIARGAAMTTPVDLWVGSRGAHRRIVMITGTKGKSTTTDLVGHLAEGAGVSVGIAGNLGIPVFSDDWAHDAPVIVIEVSSYQASDLHHVPEIAAVTSLAEDHLDWHGSYDRYRADKLRVVANDGHVAERVFVPRAEASAIAAVCELGVEPVLVDVPDHAPRLPHHRVQNAALAAAVVQALGASGIDDARHPGRGGAQPPGPARSLRWSRHRPLDRRRPRDQPLGRSGRALVGPISRPPDDRPARRGRSRGRPRAPAGRDRAMARRRHPSDHAPRQRPRARASRAGSTCSPPSTPWPTRSGMPRASFRPTVW